MTPAGRILDRLRQDLAALSPQELRQLLRHVQTALRAQRTRLPSAVPVGIFATDVSPAEAVVKWLKEEHSLQFSEIARLLNRDQRGIWGSYRRAQRKLPAPFVVKETACEIPLSLLHDRSRSILEHVVTYLKDERRLTPAIICALLKKQPSTIWTAYQRGRRKRP